MWKTTLYNTSALTLELRQIVESGVRLWDFEYPSYYSGAEKQAFEQKVLDHFWLRQIGQETVGRFLHVFRTRVREIMPYYIDMYRTVEIMHGLENPFDNVDIVETFEQDTTQESNSSTEGSANSDASNERRFSNTPQGSISNLDSYMTEASRDEASSGSSANSSTSGTGSGHTSHRMTKKGNQGVNTDAHDMIEFRQSIIDVDMMIIKDLNSLFLGVY